MRRTLTAIAALLVFAAAGPALAQSSDLETRFDAQISPAEMSAWMKDLASQPNHVGSAHDKANAEALLAKYRSWGWDARIETFSVLYPTPITVGLELISPTPFKATLTEAPIPGDESSSRTADQLPAYVAFQGDGDVTAPLVYVNYGMPADYDALERMGVSVKGKIVIARYGAGWRGLKPKLAQDHGAVGTIIYSDPRDDGYSTDDVYPKGAARPAGGFQRGSVAQMPLYPGDPLTPGVGATEKAKRLKRENAPSLLKIPVLPISYGDAQHFLAALDGNVVPSAWRGGLPITYHVGGAAKAHIVVKSDWSQKPIYNVVATMKGSTWPDQWVLRGNHHDGWVFGASDPLSGNVAMLAEAKAIGGLVAQGWKPKRTLVYLSWDAEEPLLLGSTEWVETHADELKAKGLIYINSDSNGRGFLDVGGSHAFEHLVTQVADDVTDPQTGVSVAKRLRAALQVGASQTGASETLKAQAKVAADPAKDLPIDALGSGSDYSAFLQHVGLASLNIGYGGEGSSGGVYHSAYDTWEHHSRFVDPGFAYAGALAKTGGRLVLRLADADLPLQRYSNFADTVATYLDQVKKLADAKRETADTQAKLIAAGAYRLADDPKETRGDPTPLKAVPHFNFAPLEDAVDHLKRSAKAYDAALAAKGAALSPDAKARLSKLTQGIEQTLTPEVGLPGRPWYKNLVYAPGTFTGYGAKTLPGVREAIEEERWADADQYSALTAQALNDYATELDKALKLINGG
ncbi:transferrin receptor-like dimerization domain-containing protein [Phenylobacterium sp.]|uniref:transferrin receptor-like dimerization domain-containing protein n=1 Tax=Phenylobacterium sp. TaxID=1871053 RepID=UPI00271A7636|nr:transferrin receptor-like dimerization domain-containing protein [Phenylobacterium sp.]MDO8377514.1 transferrin receptor-like dimerization domain-containing protein [Phenylobacterium sp.]